MTDEIEELVREAFVEQADRVQPVPDLAARARGRLRRRRRVRATLSGAAAILLLSTGVVVVASRHRAAPTQPVETVRATDVTSTIELKPLVARARLLTPVQLGDGALELDPPTRTPSMREGDAVRLWAAAGIGGDLLTGDTVVFLADATVRVPVALPQVPNLSSRAAPQFVHRLVWAIATGNDVPRSCPLFHYTDSAAPVSGPQPQIEAVTLIAADTVGEGITYSTGTPICAPPQRPPSAEVASYVVTEPSGASFSTPPCGTIGGTSSGSDRSGVTFSVTGVDVTMLGERCEGSMSVSILLRRPASSTGGGLRPGRVSVVRMDTLQYFDGSIRTFPT